MFARNADNITLAGRGQIDGQGAAFWTRVPRPPVPPDAIWTEAEHHDWEAGDRVTPMLELVNCRNLRIEGLTLTGASGWTVRPVNCQQVIITGIHIQNPVYGPNTDGIDVISCQDVLISDCIINAGDYAICLKSQNPYGTHLLPSRNITVTNCVITSGTNGFKIGTRTEGGFENMTFSNSLINQRMIAGIALELVDGGWVDGVVITGIQVQSARAPIFIRRGNRSGAGTHPLTRLRGVLIDGIHATNAILTSSITGLPRMPVEDVHLSNIHIDTVMPGKPAWVPYPVLEKAAHYPESRMFGWLPASGFTVVTSAGCACATSALPRPPPNGAPQLSRIR